MKDFKIPLGVEARDLVTGFQGKVVAQIRWLTGCDQYIIQPDMKSSKDGKIPEREQFDENRIVIVGKGISDKFENGEIKAENKKTSQRPGGLQPRVFSQTSKI